MALKPYNKKAIIAVMKRRELLTGEATKAPSILDFSKWPQWWESGARELEKTSPGRLITAPVRLPEALVTSTTKTVQEVPSVIKTVTNTLPIILIIAGIGGAGYFAYKAGMFKKINVNKNE